MAVLTAFPQPPYQSPMVDKNGILTSAWNKWFQQAWIAMGSAAGVAQTVYSAGVQTIFNTFATSSQTSIYTVASGKTLVFSSLTATNISSLPATISVWLVPLGSSPSDSNAIAINQAIPAGSSISVNISNQILSSQGQVYLLASGSGIVIANATGRIST